MVLLGQIEILEKFVGVRSWWNRSIYRKQSTHKLGAEQTEFGIKP